MIMDRENNFINSRREFIKRTSMMAMAVSIPVFQSCDEEDSVPNSCGTTTDILGPFYKAGAPLREEIIPANNMSPPLIVEGKVFSDCDDVLSNALVEIWNADTDGEYDTSEEYWFRGSYQTGADGLYRFKTIIPGRYLNGATYRPSHIHFRITAQGFPELVSQIYFKDDPFIVEDPWASNPAASQRILTISKDENDVDKVLFDIFLTN
jgi:protocatechuate 3,4-dioxygenase beta subunit